MTVDASAGNAYLNSYASQINSLEADPNTTSDDDATLEKQFDALKAQVLGSDNGNVLNSPSPAAPTPTDPSTTGSGIQSVGDSISQINSMAGTQAAAQVQQIADDAGSQISTGGNASLQASGAVAQAGADAAKQIIGSGGTAEQ